MVCAHGGAVRAGERANARDALERAAAAGHACVEIDVARTNDGALVTLHARDVARYSRGAIVDVGEVSRAELEMWNEDGDATLDFDAAMRAAKRGKFKQITVDFKENAPLGRDGLARKTMEVVRAMGCDECLMWGKDDETIRDAMRLGAPRVGYVVANFSMEMRAKGYDKLMRGRVKGAYAVAVQSEMITRDLVRRARRAKLAVHVWTVNDDDGMRRALNYGVDGVLTDRPERLQEIITDFRARCGREQL
jgi:glycerophosphoryl diester phosphodiesterase